MTATSYHDALRTLSEASVDQHFDAFTDIAWDDPAYAIDPRDERWVLPEADILGGTEWYRSLPREEQIRVGLYRQANVTKVGLQFEQVLIAGLMNFAFTLPNGTPEFRYATHEATEECHHTQMFQEFVNRSGVDVAGAPRLFRVPRAVPAAGRPPAAGRLLHRRAGGRGADRPRAEVDPARRASDIHPLLQRIMQIHIAEEARHIGFAHQYVEHKAPRLKRHQRFVLSLAFPVIHRWLADAILVPSRQARRDMGIPRSVVKDVYWRRPESRQLLRDLFADVRMLAENAGMMNRVSRLPLEAAQDRRPALAVPQPAVVGRRLTPSRALRRHAVVLQRRLVRRRVPGQLHPPRAR